MTQWKKSPLWVKWKWTGNDNNRKKYLTWNQARRSSRGMSPIMVTASARIPASSGSSGIMPASKNSVRTRKIDDFLRSLLNLLSTSFFVAPLPYLSLKSCATLTHPYVEASFMATRYILWSGVHGPPWAIFEGGKRTGGATQRRTRASWCWCCWRRGRQGGGRWSLGCVRMKEERKKRKEKKMWRPSQIFLSVCVWLVPRRYCWLWFYAEADVDDLGTPAAYIEKSRCSEYIDLSHPWVV